MTTDTKTGYRIKLGAVAAKLFDDLPEQTPAALDIELVRLLQTTERVATLEEERTAIVASKVQLAEHVGSLAAALLSTSNDLTSLTDMVDHRTREFEKLLLHISGLVGIHMTDGEERERLHTRLQEIEKDLGKQMNALSTLVQDQSKRRTTQVQNVVARAEEERLTIAEQERAMAKTKTERAGMER